MAYAESLPFGTYVIMNMKQVSYLNAIMYSNDIVVSLGTHDGSDMWNVIPTQSNGTILQNFGTAGFATLANGQPILASQISPQGWKVVSTGKTNIPPYAFYIQDVATGQCLTLNSTTDGIILTPLTGTAEQTWWFLSKAPASG